MSTQESTGDVPTDTVEDLMDAWTFKICLNPNQTSLDEAMEVKRRDIDKHSSIYSMTHSKRGIALIINNEKFDLKQSWMIAVVLPAMLNSWKKYLKSCSLMS